MTEPFSCRLVIAAPQAVADKLHTILAAVQIEPAALCTTGEEALLALAGGEATLLTTLRLPDMTGMALAERAGVEAPEMRIHRRTLLGRDEAGELRPLMEL